MPYTVNHEKYGIVITGKMPVDELVHLSKMWIENGYDLIDAAIAQKLNACFVITSKGVKQAAWRESLGLTPEGEESEKKNGKQQGSSDSGTGTPDLGTVG